MIYYVATERFSSTMRRFLRRTGSAMRNTLRCLTYEELFFERSGPVGHYIFSDHDRLSRYELETVIRFAEALTRAEPQARIFNHPLAVLDRVPLLAALERADINRFTAQRPDAGERPSAYPVFIRAEMGHQGPETDVLENSTAFDLALADLHRKGLPLRGRIAVGYAAKPFADGYFRRYGAININGSIIPDELFVSENWMVKDTVALRNETTIAEEMAYAQENPHQDVLRRAFAIGGMEYGRADYSVVDGEVQVYEINTNPGITAGFRAGGGVRGERRRLVAARMLKAFLELDTPAIVGRGRVGFTVGRPRLHRFHLPRRRLPASMLRLVAGGFINWLPSRRG